MHNINTTHRIDLYADIYLSMDYRNVAISHGANAMFISRTLARGSFSEYVFKMVEPKVLTQCKVKSCVYIENAAELRFQIKPVSDKCVPSMCMVCRTGTTFMTWVRFRDDIITYAKLIELSPMYIHTLYFNKKGYALYEVVLI